MENNITLGLAFLAGIVSFLSPCVLPLVPGYISFLSGVSLEELREGKQRDGLLKKPVLTAVFFVLGFSTVFIAFGASASLVGGMLAEHMYVLAKAAGIVIIVLGLHLTGVLKIKWLNYEKKFSPKGGSPGLIKAFIVGLAFGFGWSPCVGPILAGILTLAASQKTISRGMILLAAYSAGLGIPFIATGIAIGFFMKFFERYRRFIRAGEIVAGVLLIAIGALIFSGDLSVLLKFVPPVFYNFSK